MLRYDFKSIFKARGIEKPYSWLLKRGFKRHMAYSIANNRVNTLKLSLAEKLCKHFGCTPNDLLVWIPEKDEDTNIPLKKLHRKHAPFSSKESLDQLSLEEMKQLEALLKEHLG